MRNARQGFMVMDAIVGLIVVGILATLLAVSLNRQSRAARQLAESRAAMRMAERVMLGIQSGHRQVADKAPDQVKVRNISAAGVKGYEWIEVDVQLDGKQASLIGLARSAGRNAGGDK